MEQLANLPPLALVVFGITSAIIFAVHRLGITFGSSSPAASPAVAAQVAAVIVDPTALNKATSALEAHTEAQRAQTKALESQSAMLRKLMQGGEEMTRAIEHMSTEYDRLREEMRIHREIGRRDR